MPANEHPLDHTIALLSRTPAVLNTLLRDLPEIWTLGNEGEDTWSPFDVVGHLLHADRTNWIPRARMILNRGETFAPFDRWGPIRESRGSALRPLLDEFARVRSASLEELRALKLGPADLELRGQHPALGSVTLSQLLAAWAAHDLDHLHQISRVMACQYREAVGPWSKFLGVLKCSAHGD